jgi:predicted nucleic acid-binding protein
MIAALDSNIMIYAEGLNDAARGDAAHSHLLALGPNRVILPLQAIGEMAIAHIRLAKRDASFAAERARDWRQRYPVQETTEAVFDDALEIMRVHGFRIWDSIIVSAAWTAGASVLLSEDMHSGFRWRDMTIVNPLILDPSSLLEFMSLSRRH